MAETATDDELPPPAGAYTPSDDDLDELVGQATDDISTEAPDEEAEPTAATSEPESEPEAEPVETPEGEEPTEEIEEEGAEGAEPDPAAAQAAAATESKPFTFKASGAEHQFHGVTELKDGSLRTTKEAGTQLRQVLASYVELQKTSKTERRDLQRKLEAATKQRSDKDIEAEHLTKLFKDIEKMTPEERWVWAEEFTANVPTLQLEIQKAQLARDRAALEQERQGPVLSEEEQTEALTATVSTELNATFERLFKEPEAKHLTEEDRKALRERWAKKQLKLVVKADKDDPITGAKKGQWIFDDGDVVDDFLYVTSLRKSTGKTVTAAARNAKMNADQGRRQAPPTIRGGKPPVGKGTTKQKDLRGKKKEYKKAFLAGELDTPDGDG
jgi:hypothetical protein